MTANSTATVISAQIKPANCSTVGTTGLLKADEIRGQFPALRSNPDLLFFDNAATTQKPQSVVDSIATFYREDCANAGRAAYARATRLSRLVEQSRQAVARFINSETADIAFTAGATDSLNFVASSWGLNNLQDGDEVMVCLEDHQSATLPWINLQRILQHQGKNIKVVPFAMHYSGTYDRNSIQAGLSARTRLIALSHIHNLYGMEMDLQELRHIIPEQVFISLDASQSIGHIDVDVRNLGVHFLSFSGHKVFAGNGTGVLWVNRFVRQQMWPVIVGAKTALRMSQELELDRSTLAGLVECGTLNLPGIISFLPAVEFVESVGIRNIESYVSQLTHSLYRRLKEIPEVEFAPGLGTCSCTRGFGILSFKLRGIDSADLASYLDSEGILVRSGDHCVTRPGSEEFVRISLHVYNTIEEIERFVEVLRNATC